MRFLSHGDLSRNSWSEHGHAFQRWLVVEKTDGEITIIDHVYKTWLEARAEANKLNELEKSHAEEPRPESAHEFKHGRRNSWHERSITSRGRSTLSPGEVNAPSFDA